MVGLGEIGQQEVGGQGLQNSWTQLLHRLQQLNHVPFCLSSSPLQNYSLVLHWNHIAVLADCPTIWLLKIYMSETAMVVHNCLKHDWEVAPPVDEFMAMVHGR